MPLHGGRAVWGLRSRLIPAENLAPMEKRRDVAIPPRSGPFV
jgi:hypothetical protein